MNFKISPLLILNKDKRKTKYAKGFYKRKIQAEIESHNDSENEKKRDTIKAQYVLMLDRVSF